VRGSAQRATHGTQHVAQANRQLRCAALRCAVLCCAVTPQYTPPVCHAHPLVARTHTHTHTRARARPPCART
jgi:hypothetical protein